jgi:GxxExxY protein
MIVNDITGFVVDSCVKIHSSIGPGCYERVYEECLHYELIKRGLKVQRQVLMPIAYESLRIKDAYKLDLLVEQKVVLEIKCFYELHPVHFKQINTYLKLMDLKHGLLLNFKTDLMKDGIYRVFNNKGKE